jgi:hypothetical protein
MNIHKLWVIREKFPHFWEDLRKIHLKPLNSAGTRYRPLTFEPIWKRRHWNNVVVLFCRRKDTSYDDPNIFSYKAIAILS